MTTQAKLRLKIWHWFRARFSVPEGQMLPFWQRVVYACLFPLQYFYWRMSEKHGYDLQTDTWCIHGVKFSGIFFRHFAVGEDGVVRIVKEKGLVTIEKGML